MTLSVEVIPISSDSSLFKCSVLRIEDRHILLDCGWTESMDSSLYSSLVESPLFSMIDAILITHSDFAHCGALPYLLKRFHLKRQAGQFPPILATEAVKRIGELSIATLFEETEAVKDVTTVSGDMKFSLEDVVLSFDAIRGVQWGEVTTLSNLTVTPFCCGKQMGGAYWSIEYGITKIAYCVDYQLGTGRVMPGMSPLPKFPSLLVTDVNNAGQTITMAAVDASVRIGSVGDKRFTVAEDTLLQSIASTLRKGVGVISSGAQSIPTVVLPINLPQILEISCLLEEYWTGEPGMSIYPIAVISPLADILIDQAKTRLEWTSQRIQKFFNDAESFQYNPYNFKHVKFYSDLDSCLDALDQPNLSTGLPVPRLIVATSSSLEFGDARELFFRFGSDCNSQFIFTSGVEPKSLADRVLKDAYGSNTNNNTSNSNSIYREQQWSKTPFPDEHLREIYREALQKETTEDELRRRRNRERRNAQLRAAGLLPHDGGDGQVGGLAQNKNSTIDLTILAGNFENSGEPFFRPQLFLSQTLAASGTLKLTKPILPTESADGPTQDEYGLSITTQEVDTWRAHSNAEGLQGAVAEDDEDQKPEMKKQMKRAKEEQTGIKQQQGIKEDLYATEENTFDWRRDMKLRFGEPMRVEQRDRQVRVLCRISYSPTVSVANQRREFLHSVQAKNVIFLPSSNKQDVQLLSLKAAEIRAQFCQEEAENDMDSILNTALTVSNGEPPMTVSRSVELQANRKFVHIDPALLKSLRVQSVSGNYVTSFENPLIELTADLPDTEILRNPSGHAVEAVYTTNVHSTSRKRRKSFFLSENKFRAHELKNLFVDSLKDEADAYDISFEGPLGAREVVIENETGYATLKRTGDGEWTLHSDAPCDAFFTTRRLFYKLFNVV